MSALRRAFEIEMKGLEEAADREDERFLRGIYDNPVEMNGLAQIIGSPVTLHAIEGPPDQEAFETDDEYDRRYRAWHARVTYWHATVGSDARA